MAWVCALAWRPRLRVDSVARMSGGPGPGIRFCWPLAPAGGNSESVFLLVVHVEVEYGTCMYASL